MDRSTRDELIAASALGGLIQALSHWFPWNKATGDELHAPLTYVVGAVPILGLYSTWARRREHLSGQDAATGLMAIFVSSGIAVLLGYGLDIIMGKRFEDRMRRIGDGQRPSDRAH